MSEKQAARERIRAARRTEFLATTGGLGEILRYLTNVTKQEAKHSWIKGVHGFTSEGPDGAYHGVGFVYQVFGLDGFREAGSAEVMVLRTRKSADRVAKIINTLIQKHNKNQS